MNYKTLDTPALIIDKKIMEKNLEKMQKYADSKSVDLRPHTKTHKMSKLAKLQMKFGAKGIAVAKVGEAEVMAREGIKDIFIANEIVGDKKLNRIKELAKNIDISFGIDSIAQVFMIDEVFEGFHKKAQVLIEIEVGEERSGIIEMKDYIDLLSYLKQSKNVNLKGIFSHDGHSYKAKDVEECRKIHIESQKRTLEFVREAQNMGFDIETVSIGSTPSMMNDFEILDGITEIRPGTYIFMDASQANAYGSYEVCAASVLTTIISLPTSERIITDVGAKGITAQERTDGFCKSQGLGKIKGHLDVSVDGVFDEHAIIYNKKLRDESSVGDTLEIIPNHICPVVNLHESAYIVEDGEIIEEIEVDCRGKLK